MMLFKKRKDEVEIGNLIPEHERNPELKPLKHLNKWDEFEISHIEPSGKQEEKKEDIPPADFFSLPPAVESQTPIQHRSEITRVDVELILSKLENIDHRLRWMEDQLRRRGTI